MRKSGLVYSFFLCLGRSLGSVHALYKATSNIHAGWNICHQPTGARRGEKGNHYSQTSLLPLLVSSSLQACGRKYCTVEERRQHLVDHHRFPRGGAMGLDRIHLRSGHVLVAPLRVLWREGGLVCSDPAFRGSQLGGALPAVCYVSVRGTSHAEVALVPACCGCRRKKGQVRALPQYRKGNGGRHGMGMESAQAPAAASSGQQAEPAGLAPDGGGSAAAAGTAGSGSMQDEELPDVAHSLSRLSMAAEASTVPNVVSFGRRQPGRGIPGVQRGRGGQKVHKGFVD